MVMTATVKTFEPKSLFQPRTFDNESSVPVNVEPKQANLFDRPKLKLDLSDPKQVYSYGSASKQNIASYANQILANVRTDAVGEIGGQLTQIITIAKGFNISDLNGTSSKIPLIGRFIDSFKKNRERYLSRFDSVSEQLDKIIKNVEQSSSLLSKRNEMLSTLHDKAVEEFKLLDKEIQDAREYIAYERARLKETVDKATLDGSINDMLVSQQLNDWKDNIDRFDLHVTKNLETDKVKAFQKLPQIRIIQKGNQLLIDKFIVAKERIIPGWKDEIVLRLSLEDQKRGVELGESIDDLSDQLTRTNMDLLKQNATTVAKSQGSVQRQVDALQYANNTLIETFNELADIDRQNKEQATQAIEAFKQMQDQLTETVAKHTN
jgi:uncharacterized protein YaaN involved in tellurite resistance